MRSDRPGRDLEIGNNAKRRGRCGLDELIEVDRHAIGQRLELIHQADIDSAMNVREQLGHLCSLGAAHRHHLADHLGIQCLADLPAGGGAAALHLGDRSSREALVA